MEAEDNVWTDEEKNQSHKDGVIFLLENTTLEEVKKEDSNLPNDSHLIMYYIESIDKKFYDVVRAHKMVDIFDIYHSKMKAIGGMILSIDSGYGKVNPKLWSNQKSKNV